MLTLLLVVSCTVGQKRLTTEEPELAWPELRPAGEAVRPQLLQEGTPAPDIRLVGSNFDFGSIAELQGKRVFMTFWNTWCPYCREVLPQYDQLRQDLAADDIVWMFVNQVPQEAEGSDEAIRPYLEQTALTTPVVLDRTGEVAFMYGVRAVPTTVVINADGELVAIIPGAMPYDMAKLALDYAADPTVLDP